MIETLSAALTMPFLQRALLVGLSVSITAACLGIFITLRNLSFYADTIAHASLVGIALGLLLNIEPMIAALVFCVLLGIGTVMVKRRSSLGMDTVVGVLFATSLALGVFLLSFIPSYRAELFSILFGDILTTNWPEVIVTVAVGGAVLLFLLFTGKRLLLMTFSPDFAFIRGIRQSTLEYAFFIMTALTIAVSIKVVGIILLAGLLILPAAISRNIAQSFRQFVRGAVLMSALALVVGLSLSYAVNLPTGPTIILVGGVIFFLTLMLRRR